MTMTPCQQKIVIKMLCNGHKTNYFDQEIYPSFRVFQQEMQKLKNADLLNIKLVNMNNKKIMEYSLSIDGVIFAKLLKMVNDKLII